MIVADEFGSGLHGASPVAVDPGPDAAAYAVPCFQHGNIEARLSEHAGSHETRKPGADDHDGTATHRRGSCELNLSVETLFKVSYSGLDVATSFGRGGRDTKTPIQSSIEGAHSC